MAITTNLKKSDGVDLGNNLFAGNGTSNGNQTFNIIQSNGVDLGKGWYNKTSCSAAYGNVGFKNSAGTDVGTLLGKYGTLNCVDTDVDQDACDSDGCFIKGNTVTARGLIPIADIVMGDRIWGADEKWHRVLGIAKGKVGGRHVYQMMNGGCVTADHVVYQGEAAYAADLDDLQESCGNVLTADNGVQGVYNVPTNVMEIDGAISSLPPDTETYSPICDSSFVGYLNGERVLFAGMI